MTNHSKHLSYRDIKKIAIDRMQNNIWAPNSLLPSEAELAEEFSSTRTTVNRALRELAKEGYLERKRKAGTRVLGSPARTAQFTIPLVRDEVEAEGAAYKYARIEHRLDYPPTWLAAKLGIDTDREILFLRCMHYANGKAFQYEVRWVMVDVVPDILKEDFTSFGPGDWLVKNVPFSNLELSFTATAANQEIADFLEANIGDPIFTMERMTWLQSSPVTYTRLYFAPGYKMTTSL